MCIIYKTHYTWLMENDRDIFKPVYYTLTIKTAHKQIVLLRSIRGWSFANTHTHIYIYIGYLYNNNNNNNRYICIGRATHDRS